MWAGGEAPVEEKSAAQRKLDKDMIECAFDGELDEMKKLLEEGECVHAVFVSMLFTFHFF